MSILRLGVYIHTTMKREIVNLKESVEEYFGEFEARKGKIEML